MTRSTVAFLAVVTLVCGGVVGCAPYASIGVLSAARQGDYMHYAASPGAVLAVNAEQERLPLRLGWSLQRLDAETYFQAQALDLVWCGDWYELGVQYVDMADSATEDAGRVQLESQYSGAGLSAGLRARARGLEASAAARWSRGPGRYTFTHFPSATEVLHRYDHRNCWQFLVSISYCVEEDGLRGRVGVAYERIENALESYIAGTAGPVDLFSVFVLFGRAP